MAKIPKHLLKLMTSCYGSWHDCNECVRCELCIVCRIYSDYPILDNIGRLLLREKQMLKKKKFVGFRDCENAMCHEQVDKLLNSEEECKKCEALPYRTEEDEEVWAMNFASEVDLNICKKCKDNGINKSKEGCLIAQYLDQWDGFYNEIKRENIPMQGNFNEDEFSTWCPLYLEQLLARQGKKK